MRAYIKKLQSKDEGTRKRIFVGTMIGSMSIVTLIWVYGLGVRFTNPSIKEHANEDIKPFKLFSNSISSTYSNISASVGKASLKNNKEKEQKQIDLIPIEYTNQ